LQKSAEGGTHIPVTEVIQAGFGVVTSALEEVGVGVVGCGLFVAVGFASAGGGSVGLIPHALHEHARIVGQGDDVEVRILAIEVARPTVRLVTGPVTVRIVVKEQDFVDVAAAVDVLAPGFPGAAVEFSFLDAPPAVI